MSGGFCTDCPRIGGTAARSQCCMAEYDAIVDVMDRFQRFDRRVLQQIVSSGRLSSDELAAKANLELENGNRAQRRKQRAQARKARK